MIDLQNYFLSTYSSSLLSDWNTIRDIIITETKWTKDALQSTDNETPNNPLLEISINEKQLNDALNGPFHTFFNMHLCAYATITKIESALTIRKEDFFKESGLNSTSTLEIPNNFLDKQELPAIKQRHEKCDELTKQHHEEWKAQIENWNETLLAEFKQNNLQLSDLEIQAFKANQTIAELNEQFIDLKLTLPKLSKGHFDFQQYFILKSSIAIQSALGRMQQLQTEKEVQRHLKTLQSQFKAINKAEIKINETQKQALKALIAPLKPK